MALNHPEDEGGASTSNKEAENDTANATATSTDVDTTTSTIKTMKLYTHLDRIDKELEASGLLLPTQKNGVSNSTAAAETNNSNNSNTPRRLTATQLSPFDCLHYLGDAAVRQAVQSAAIGDSTAAGTTVVVLDLGSGLGGTARLVASWCDGCRVDALELQPDLHARAEQLTAACGLSDRVRHYCGDILSDHHHDGDGDDNGTKHLVRASGLPTDQRYGAIVSFLVFLHIADRAALFQRCWDRLEPGGRMYVEDYCRVPVDDDQFRPRELDLLATEVYVRHELPTWEQLRAELQGQGFAVVECRDMTTPWRAFVRQRAQDYAAQWERHRTLYGSESAAALGTFYKAVDELFQGGRLGGVAYTVEKPIS